MSKPEGLFTIGEIAACSGLSINALRFYEVKRLIAPAHTDPQSGYRYYSRENMLHLRAVLLLKDAGLSLSEIRDYLDGNRDTKSKLAQLNERRALLDRAIEDLRIRETEPGDLAVYEIELPERICLCRTVEAESGAQALAAVGEFYDEVIRSGITISRAWPEFCEYPDAGLLQGKFSATGFTVTACLPVDKGKAPPEAVLFPQGKAVAVNYRGSYYGLSAAYEVLGRYIDAKGYAPAGYPQEIYTEIGPDGLVRLDDENNITRVIVPIK